MMKPMPRKIDDQYTDEEAERRAREAIARAFTMPYKPQKQLVRTTQRTHAKAKAPSARGYNILWPPDAEG
jgi:hypothetical protein